jgi:hypothetical protein
MSNGSFVNIGKWINCEKKLSFIIGCTRLFTNTIWDELFGIGSPKIKVIYHRKK